MTIIVATTIFDNFVFDQECLYLAMGVGVAFLKAEAGLTDLAFFFYVRQDDLPGPYYPLTITKAVEEVRAVSISSSSRGSDLEWQVLSSDLDPQESVVFLFKRFQRAPSPDAP